MSRVLEELAQALEDQSPAVVVRIAHFLVEELVVAEIELGAATRVLEDDRHERFALRRGPRPAPGEDELAVRHHLLVDTGALVLFAVGAAEYDAVAPAYAQVKL